MKLTIILLTAAIMNVSAKGLSQTVSFNGKNVSLQEVFSSIEKQTGFKVAYNKSLLDRTNPVSLQMTNIPLKDFLQQVLKDQPLSFSIEEKTVFIGRKDFSVDRKVVGEILAPPGNIQGRVTNENGEPLAGANVMLKSATGQGSSADINGYYKIENVGVGEYTLLVSFVGYATKTAFVKVSENAPTVIDFILRPSLVNLDQLTVTSTLSARKIRAYPATIAVVNQEDLKNRNINNITSVLEALPGIIIQPGFEVSNTNNRSLSLLIRGASGYGVAGIKYLIDGVEIVADAQISVLQQMDPNTIEKIEVLKGPMASTLYGSGAGGGVIAITTKKGKGGKTMVNLKSMYTQYANDYANYSGYSQNYSANISGGNEQFNYLLGAAYNLYPITKLSDTSNGIDDKTWSYTARIGGKIKSIAADVSLQYANERSGTGSTTLSDNKYFASIGYPTYPIVPIQDARNTQRSFLTNLHLTHTIANNCYQDLTIGYNIVNRLINNYSMDFTGSYPNYEYLYSKVNARYFLFYDHSWSTAIKTNITTGFEYSGYETHSMTINSTTPLTDFFTSSTPATASSATFTKSPYSSKGYFAEAVTSFKNNFFLTTGIRYDINNAYGESIGGYAQPRVGLSYVLESTKFKIKPRAVWGVSSTPPDPTFKTTSITPYPQYGFIQIISGNKDIKPQRSEGYEFGADIFYGSNYSLNVTYYDQRIKDMIQSSSSYDYSVNPYLFSIYYYNIGEVINKGLEVSAKAVLDPFTFDISYTETNSKWSKNTGQLPNASVYPGAPLLSVPKRSFYARLSYSIPSLLPWTKKGGRISLDWRYNGSAYNFNSIGYSLATNAWNNAPDPKPDYPDYTKYYTWQKGYSYFNLRADYSLTNYAALYLDIQNLLDKQGSVNGQNLNRFPGRRINFGFNINF